MTAGKENLPAVTVVHALRGRIRMLLSRELRDEQRMISAMMEHEGMLSIRYTPITRSVVVRYDPGEVQQEEIILRVAFFLSLDHDAVPVRVLAEPERQDLTDSSIYSAILLLSALASRLVVGKGRAVLPFDRVAGAGTALAILIHGWKEMRERGYFDPEVLSLGYLLTSFTQNNFLRSSLFTWILTFGRHLVNLPEVGVTVKPLEIGNKKGSEFQYELLIEPDTEMPDSTRILSALQSLLKYVITGGAPPGRRTLMEEIREVSRVHGEVLEGLGKIKGGIPIQIR